MKIHHVGALFVVAVSLWGCGGDDPGSDGTGGAAGSMSVSPPPSNGGAGTSGAGGTAPTSTLEQFIGTWKYTSGTLTTICAGQTTTTQLSGQDEEFAHAVDGGLTLKGTCAVKLSVAGTSATATNASCTSVGNDGSSETDTYSSLVFSTLDGLNMTISASGTIGLLSNGESLSCTFSVTGGLMKYAN
jgi:hypothetical protein